MRRAVLIGVLVALAAPVAAYGHASISRSAPSYRQRLAEPPKRVEIDFDQAVKVFPNGIHVYDVHGRDLARDVHSGSGGHAIVALLSHRLAKGAYTVRWQALSGDGHVVSGVYTFGVRVTAPEPTQAYGASGPTTTENVLRWLYFVCLALTIGGIAFRLVILPAAVPHSLERVFYAFALIGPFAAIQLGALAFLLRAQDALQLPFGRFLYGDLSPFADGTRFGEAFVVMTLGFAVVSALVFLAWLTERRRLLWPALALSLALAAGLSLSGHSAVDPPSSKWSELADWVHLSSASLWAGGVLMLLAVFLTAPELRRDSFVRFARLAPALIALLLAAGIYLSVLRLPSLDDLWTTGYGHVLLLKLSLVATALAWGGFHHFVVEPRLGEPRVAGRVRGSLAGETAVGLAVLLVAAFLVNSKPPTRTAPPSQAAGVTVRR
jgi:copper transport protein